MPSPERSHDSDRCNEVLMEYFLRIDRGETFDREQFIAEHPQVADALREYFSGSGLLTRGLPSTARTIPHPSCSAEATAPLDSGATPPGSDPAEATPTRIGRYRVERLLGWGGFGRVYLAHDDDLHRPVAIKVPHPDRVATPAGVSAFLTEARLAAQLDHPAIVPVHDVGRTDDGLCYVVSKFIHGGSLYERLKQSRPAHGETAELVAVVAEALHYAHQHGLVHRDIKPANILLDDAGRPYVTDFGLALQEHVPEVWGRFAGTPAYMSPEQAHGEGHRVDGRSDVFALGVVLYEMLSGARPYAGHSRTELLQHMDAGELHPLRQRDRTIPVELERICLKALARRATDRYRTCAEMTDDLRQYLASRAAGAVPAVRTAEAASVTGGGAASRDSVGSAASLGAEPIVCKGLRCFDAHDAGFFLHLLPGPRGRDGLPETIRGWKARIEETIPERTFTVGLIYGPSGCGKSSLVRAGLLPRLADAVQAIYLDASPDRTESQLLSALRRHYPELPAEGGLPESLAALRRGTGLAEGRKLLIVLDQFEQWLNVRQGREQSDLAAALRQCDGVRVQCLLLVRDDFWLAVSRFMRQLEIHLVEGQNCGLVDLFDVRHTLKVLTAFGRSFGALPESNSELTGEQRAFLEQSAAALAEDGRVACVRLALFAEMMKSQPWKGAALRDLGGTEGLGAAFLEEKFGAATATPRHRRHAEAARRVLRGLLPEAGVNLRGHMRSERDLRDLSGYTARPDDFAELIEILTNELRLVTPADPAITRFADPAGSQDDLDSHGYYQLTHDYLVPSLREWLVARDRATRSGRARLLLADRAALWSAKPEQVRLPTLLEWLSIRLWTRRAQWTEPQRRMLRAAGRFHLIRLGLVLLLIAGVACSAAILRQGWLQQREVDRAVALVSRLLDAEIAQVPGIVQEISGCAPYARQAVAARLAEAAASEDKELALRARMAILPTDRTQTEWLSARLLEAEPDELAALCRTLGEHGALPLADLWRVAENPSQSAQRRFRAACALACYGTAQRRWKDLSALVAEQLVAQNVLLVKEWKDILRPQRALLVDPLIAIFRDRSADRTTQRRLATEILADFASDRPDVLCELLGDADREQFVALYPAVKRHRREARGRFEAELDRTVPVDAGQDAQDTLAKRQANAAVALLEMSQPERVWPLLRYGPDPRLRNYLIHLFRPLAVDPERLIEQLSRAADPGIRAALILGLGEYPAEQVPENRRETLIADVAAIFHADPDPGVHGAAQWALRRWDRAALMETTESRQPEPSSDTERRWYVDRWGHTMVIIPGPVEYTMGAPPYVTDREINEGPVRMRIGRSFAIADKEVTRAQFDQFLQDQPELPRKTLNPQVRSSGGPNSPIKVNFHEAAAYCRWLSEQEGTPEDQMCYPPNGEFLKSLKPYPDYLSRTGYRLPSETEWEYACLAGAVTVYSCGNAPELLHHYGWNHDNVAYAMQPVGSLKPNAFGLFDMHGGAWEWCFDSYNHRDRFAKDGAAIHEDIEDLHPVVHDVGRITRGGSFYDAPVYHRAFVRNPSPPWADCAGIRPVRTWKGSVPHPR